MEELKIQGFKFVCFGIIDERKHKGYNERRYIPICKNCPLLCRYRTFLGQEKYWRMYGIAKDGRCPIKEHFCK